MAVTLRNHTTEAYDRLLQQFKDKPNTAALLALFTARYDGLEAVFYALLVERTIYAAVGAQLDQIGAIVGQPRQGLDDDTYRRYILARVAANSSDGLVEDLIAVTRLVLNDSTQTLQVVTTGIATTIVRVTGGRVEWATAAVIAELLRSSVEGGVRMLLEFETFPAVTITKSGGSSAAWDAGASSVETFAGDGYVETKVTDIVNSRMFGLNTTDTSASYTDIDYAVNLRFDGQIDIHENGTQVGFLVGTYSIGDVIRIERVGTTIYFKKNGTTFYTSLTPSSAPLRVDVSFFSVSATTTLSDVRLYVAGKRTQITWQNALNVTITPPMPNVTYAQRARFADATVFNGAAFYPQTPAAVTTALGGLGIWTAGAGWLFDELSGSLAPIFGAPTLTPVGSPTYGSAGPRGGTDKAVGFDSALDAFSAGDTFDVTATDDLVIAWIGKFSSNPGANRDVMGKWQAGVNGWSVVNRLTALRLSVDDGVFSGFSETSSLYYGEWHVGIIVIDRGAARARIGIRGLTSGTSTLGAELNISTLTTLANASSLLFGCVPAQVNSADTSFSLAAVYVNSGAAVASTMSANLSAALTSFANYISRSAYGAVAQPTSYGNGADDEQDKYPRSPAALAQILGRGDFTSGAGWLFNMASGNAPAAFGSPTLTASGSPVYGVVGPRGGRDLAIGFSTVNDVFSGGTGDFDVSATDDIVIAWVGKIASAPANTDVFGKGNAGAARWLLWHGTGGFAWNVNDGVDNLEVSTASLAFGEWHVGLAVLERATNQIKVGIRTLAGVTTVSSTGDATLIGSLSNAVAVKFGKSVIGTADILAKYAALYITKGSGVATGMVANMSTMLTNFAAQINRYYGGCLSAVME